MDISVEALLVDLIVAGVAMLVIVLFTTNAIVPLTRGTVDLSVSMFTETRMIEATVTSIVLELVTVSHAIDLRTGMMIDVLHGTVVGVASIGIDTLTRFDASM